MKNNLFPEYSIDYITNVMGLRKPQKRSLKILADILDEVELSKDNNLTKVRETIHEMYPIFSEFEHEFMSLAYAIATGVGKTKLMGVFITYLYTNYGIKNFFVVAPNLTIYEKLKNDLSNDLNDNLKYVFRGLSCFATNKPRILADDDYKQKAFNNSLISNSINIYIFNIDKFNSEERSIRSLNEMLGDSFFNYLKKLDDLVLIMDESHHYRAKQSMKAINELNPVLGIELTATPQVQSGSKTILFKNVVYEYPLSQAIKDGYTRTPYALTRKDINKYDFNDEELDKVMINDGINHHERIKMTLTHYSKTNNKKLVKPFMLIVCKDTTHAEQILAYIKSDSFKEGKYKNKVIMIHSNQKGTEKDENIRLLLAVEDPNNIVEIVIHVNILKEGWDVNNLYTIVPLRTATSKTLREQTIGRGLRLPYGVRTGNDLIDSVTITAHDKFEEIIQESLSDESIFKKGCIIYAEDEEKQKITTVSYNSNLFGDLDLDEKVMNESNLDKNNIDDKKFYEYLKQRVAIHAADFGENKNEQGQKVLEKIKEDISNDTDFAERFNKNETKPLLENMLHFGVVDDIVNKVNNFTIYVPQMYVEFQGDEKYIITDFDINMDELKYVPISNEILIQNLIKQQEVYNITSDVIDFNTIKPEKYLVDLIRDIAEIDYEKSFKLIQKLIIQFLTYYRNKYSDKEVRNIVVGNGKDIVRKISDQIIRHLAISYDGLVETVSRINTIKFDNVIIHTDNVKNINEAPAVGVNIKTLAYEGMKKSLTSPVRFDSDPERKFAICCDNSNEVICYIKPSLNTFNIEYDRGKKYNPDFIVETEGTYYLVEVKAKNKMNDATVLAKKERALQYCKIASQYNIANGHKGFKYLFIPDDAIMINSSFNYFVQMFCENR